MQDIIINTKEEHARAITIAMINGDYTSLWVNDQGELVMTIIPRAEIYEQPTQQGAE